MVDINSCEDWSNTITNPHNLLFSRVHTFILFILLPLISMAKKKQIAPCYGWAFTLPCAPPKDLEVAVVAVVARFSDVTDLKFCFRREKANSGLLHLQGVVWTTRKDKKGRRWQFRPMPMLNVDGFPIHWERMKHSPQCNIDYCCSTGDHAKKEGGFGDPVHNLVMSDYPKSWKEKSQEEIDARAEKEEYDDALKRYNAFKEIHDRKRWAERTRFANRKIRPIDGWKEDHTKCNAIEKHWRDSLYDEKYSREHRPWWTVLSWGDANTFDDWLIFVKQFDQEI